MLRAAGPGFNELFALLPAQGGGWIAPGAPRTEEKRLFGGLLIGQAIVAASHQTRRCHSLHGFFIGVGEMEAVLDIAIEPMRDGGSFSTQRIEIRQGARLLLAGYSSHHDGDPGPDHQAAMPDLPLPQTLADQRELRQKRAAASGGQWRRYLAEEMLDIRPIELPEEVPGTIARRAMWFRPRIPIEGGEAMHQAAIGFASDTGLVHVGLLAPARSGTAAVQSASLDHAVWFHRLASANQWMLHVQRSSTVAHGRGLSQAQIFSQNGTLVASVAQEFLARNKRPGNRPA